MLVKEFCIANAIGLHARPAAQFVEKANLFKSEITVSKNEKTVNGKSIIGILGLEASKGSTITININGVDEEEALQALSDTLNSLTD
jgi:phosphocarrier protein HPr